MVFVKVKSILRMYISIFIITKFCSGVNEECFSECKIYTESSPTCYNLHGGTKSCEIVRPTTFSVDTNQQHPMIPVLMYSTKGEACNGRCRKNKCFINPSETGECTLTNTKIHPIWADFGQKLDVHRNKVAHDLNIQISNDPHDQSEFLYMNSKYPTDGEFDEIVNFINSTKNVFYSERHPFSTPFEYVTSIYEPGYNDRTESNIVVAAKALLDVQSRESSPNDFDDKYWNIICKIFPSKFLNLCKTIFNFNQKSFPEFLKKTKPITPENEQIILAIKDFCETRSGKAEIEVIFRYDRLPFSVDPTYFLLRLKITRDATSNRYFDLNKIILNVNIMYQYASKVSSK